MPSANALDHFIIGYRDARTGEPHDPNPKQRLAHISIADELLYGGAAFGGKSEFVVQEAVAICLMYARCDVAVFRRRYTELEHDLINRFLLYVPRSIATYNGQKKIATFYNGSRLLFCHCHTEKDKYNYKSDQWTALLIDQADDFTESIVTFLFSRVRSPQGYPTKIRLSANPGGVGHGWLKARYIAPSFESLGNRSLPTWDGEVWRPMPNPDIPGDVPMTRAFIQALMTDNQPGMLADPTYVQKIRANPNEVERRMYELGDWDAFQGQMFGMWRASKYITETDTDLLDAGLSPGTFIPWHVIPDPFWQPPRNVHVFGSGDYGYGEPWSFHFHAAMPDGHIVTFKEFYETKVRDVHQAERLRDYIREQWAIQRERHEPEWEIPYLLADLPFGTRLEHGLAKSVFEVYEDILAIPLKLSLQVPAKGAGSRKTRVQRMIDALSPHVDGFPNWQVTTACPNLIRTLPALVVDPNDRDDILHGTGDRKQEDHAYDDTTYFLSSRPPFPKAERGSSGRSSLGVAFGVNAPERPSPSKRLNVRAFGRQL